MENNYFESLSQINVNDKTEKKNGLTYLSWAWAWEVVKKKHPKANYIVDHYEGKPYLFDEDLGYMVSTKVTIDGETLPMHLPVMDGANKAQKNIDYTYQVKDWSESKIQKKDVFKNKKVLAATMFDINTAIMRCLVKNLAMFGLGLYIYAGEDLPPQKEILESDAVTEMKATKTQQELNAVWAKYPQFKIDGSDFYKATAEQGVKFK